MRQIKKWKAIFNVDISQIKKGIHYYIVYSPMAGWPSISILLIQVVLE